MNPNQILVKTDKGRDEIKTRSLALSQHARNLLIAADGQKSCGTLAQLYSKVPDVNAVLQELADQGLVELQGGNANGSAGGVRQPGTAPPSKEDDAGTQKLRHAIQYLNDTINSNVGFGGFTLTLKVGRCQTLDDVRALIPEYQAAVTKKRGADTAEALTTKLLDILK